MRIGSRESRGRLVAAVALLQFGFGHSETTTSSSTSISHTASPTAEALSTSSTSLVSPNPPKGQPNPISTGSTPSPSPAHGQNEPNQGGRPDLENYRRNKGVNFDFILTPYLRDRLAEKAVTEDQANAAVIRIDMNLWQNITWNAPSKKIERLKLHKRIDDEKSVVIAGTVNDRLDGYIEVPSPQALKDVKSLVEGKLVKRQESKPGALFTVTVDPNGAGRIDFAKGIPVVLDMLLPVSPLRTDLLFFEAVFSGGSSYSRVFALTTTQVEWEQVVNPAFAQLSNLTDPTPARLENITQSAQRPSTSTGAEAPTESTANSSVSASESGLPTGAKIGIAVGAGVAGLLILIVLVWLAVRWRRKRKNLISVGSYGPNGRADELMAQKEASAGVDAPHSPYSDDGEASGSGSGYRDRSGVAAAAVVAPHHQHQHSLDHSRSSTPFLDRSSSRPGGGPGTPSVRAASVAHTESEIPRTTMASPIPGRATPRALTTPYAHLVEEGMTEEEIRRLEEEERQLDAAIEQAGRR